MGFQEGGGHSGGIGILVFGQEEGVQWGIGVMVVGQEDGGTVWYRGHGGGAGGRGGTVG